VSTALVSAMARRGRDERPPADDRTTFDRDGPYDDPYDGDPYEETDDYRWYSPRGWWPALGDRTTSMYDGRPPNVETAGESAEHEGDGGWLGIGLSTTIVVAGVLLFLFPEPATSAVGLLLVFAGTLMWLFELVAS